MTKSYFLESVALKVKVLQIESECFRFKTHKAISCYLAVPQPTLTHYQKDSPTTSMLITTLFTTLTQRSPGGFSQLSLAVRFLLTSDQSCFNAEINIELVRLTP